MSDAPVVLQIGNRWFPEAPGGLERYHYDLARHLPAAGFEVQSFAVARKADVLGPGTQMTAYAAPNTFIMHRLSALRRAVKNCLDTGRVALVACHYPLYSLPLFDLMRTLPTVFHFHGPWAAEGKIEGNSLPAWLSKRCIEQILYQRPAGFVVLSAAFRDILCGTYGVRPERVFVIPGGADMTRFDGHGDRLSARRTLGWEPDRPIAVTLRRLNRRMGIESLIDAMQQVTSIVPRALLLIGGSGPLQAAFEQRIEQRGLGGNVRLLGRIPDEQLPLFYRAADVSIMPSAALEGFGLTAAESLACGTPVLVTPIGGLPEVVTGLSPDLVLKGTEPEALAEGLIRAFSGDLHLPDAAACATYARNRFDWPIIARQVAACYRTIIDEASIASPTRRPNGISARGLNDRAQVPEIR
jgi:glycosyltransferase involved in cell wall biosynthesis